MLLSLILLLVASPLADGARMRPSGPPATLTFTPAAAWKPKAVTSMMRVGEFVLPRAEGDAEDASLVVYFFGGTGGSVQANLDRWVRSALAARWPADERRRHDIEPPD